MLEKINFDTKPIEKDEYKATYKDMIERLIVAQQRAIEEGIGLVVLFEGWNGAGKGSRISDLMYNLDARATSVYVSPDVDLKEARKFVKLDKDVTGFYPLMQEYWTALGERSHITFYDRGWYTKATELMLDSKLSNLVIPKLGTRNYLESIHDFERQLTNDGYEVVKFFIHVRNKSQKERLEKLHDNKATRWRVSDEKIASTKNYNELYEIYDKLLDGSNFDFAPWVLINGEEKRSANIQIAAKLLETIEDALLKKEQSKIRKDEDDAKIEIRTEQELQKGLHRDELDLDKIANEAILSSDDDDSDDVRLDIDLEKAAKSAMSVHEIDAEAKARAQHVFAPKSSRFEIVKDYPSVDAINHSLSLDPKEYKKQLKSLQKELFDLENLMYQERIPLILMYEGWDAAGKGGNIKRVAQALDARAYTIYPSPAPTKPELAHPHLWRYWTRLPKAGHVGMYDRSWYGRVLVERVEEFTPPERWAQGYDEINEFEHDLIDWGAILLKFWVDVSPDEQLRRFEDRENNPAKQWKITPDDWRNREKYPQYKSAIDDMFRLTSTTYAPWIVLESNDKKYARIKALRIIVESLKHRLSH